MLIFVFTKFHRTDFFYSAVFFIKLKLRKVIVVSMINDERLRQKAPALIKEVRSRVVWFGFIWNSISRYTDSSQCHDKVETYTGRLEKYLKAWPSCIYHHF